MIEQDVTFHKRNESYNYFEIINYFAILLTGFKMVTCVQKEVPVKISYFIRSDFHLILKILQHK